MLVRIGTRGSQLAMWQATHVSQYLASQGWETEFVEVSTHGDQQQDAPLYQLGSVGLFTKALDDALLRGDCDIAVHSAKDLPSMPTEGIDLLAFLQREDVRDVLLGRSEEVHLENFSRPLVIGTSSVRRRALLTHHFPGIQLKNIRGNVDTRLRKMTEGEYDGIVLAMAGVKRLGLTRHIVQKFNPHALTPAVGQGAIAVACRRGYEHQAALRAILNHVPTEYALRAERAFLRALRGGCSTPAFALATLVGATLTMTAGLAEEDGSRVYRQTLDGPAAGAESLGEQIAAYILSIKQS